MTINAERKKVAKVDKEDILNLSNVYKILRHKSGYTSLCQNGNLLVRRDFKTILTFKYTFDNRNYTVDFDLQNIQGRVTELLGVYNLFSGPKCTLKVDYDTIPIRLRTLPEIGEIPYDECKMNDYDVRKEIALFFNSCGLNSISLNSNDSLNGDNFNSVKSIRLEDDRNFIFGVSYTVCNNNIMITQKVHVKIVI